MFSPDHTVRALTDDILDVILLADVERDLARSRRVRGLSSRHCSGPRGGIDGKYRGSARSRAGSCRRVRRREIGCRPACPEVGSATGWVARVRCEYSWKMPCVSMSLNVRGRRVSLVATARQKKVASDCRAAIRRGEEIKAGGRCRRMRRWPRPQLRPIYRVGEEGEGYIAEREVRVGSGSSNVSGWSLPSASERAVILANDDPAVWKCGRCLKIGAQGAGGADAGCWVRVRDDGVTYTHSVSRPVAGSRGVGGGARRAFATRSGLFPPLCGLFGYGRRAGLKSGAIRADPSPRRELGWPDRSINNQLSTKGPPARVSFGLGWTYE